MDSSGTLGQRLHVRISETCYLQVLFCLHNVGKRCHQTNCRPCFKQHNACKHAKLWVEGLVHVELKSQVLDLIWKRKQTQCGHACRNKNGFTDSLMLRIYLCGLLLCNVPQGHDGLSMDSDRQRYTHSAMYGQDLCDWLNAARMASITQNLQLNNDFLHINFSNSLC